MSNEHRIPDQTISIKMGRIRGTIQHGLLPKKRVEIFGAYQFKTAHNRLEANFYPKVPIDADEKKRWYENRFRLRVDGKWHMSHGKKYVFLTRKQVSEFLLRKYDIEEK